MAIRRLLTALLLSAPLVACAEPPANNLDLLLVRDSTYLDPVSLEPFTGPVFKTFVDDRENIQMRGTIEGGTWNGELTVYHPNGRVRFQGELVNGVQCGAWVEDEDDAPAESVYEEIVKEIESLVMYPECPDEPGG